MSAPVDVTSPHCGCGCRPAGLEPGCPCPECQPGPGIDHAAGQSRKEKERRERMKTLLHRPDELLSDEEREELDGLLHWYIHRM